MAYSTLLRKVTNKDQQEPPVGQCHQRTTGLPMKSPSAGKQCAHKSMKKLNGAKASYFMAGHFKAIRQEIKRLAQHRNFAGVVQALINHLKLVQSDGQEAQLTRHICYLGKIYGRGNDYVRYILENLFVRSLSSMRRQTSPANWQRITRKFPKPFMEIYQQQVNEQIS